MRDKRNPKMTAVSETSDGQLPPRRRAATADSATLEEQCHPRKIFIGGLAHKTTTQNVRDYFARYGTVVDAVVLRWPDGRSRGFGYVTFSEAAGATAALREAHQVGGRQVDVKRAVPGTNKLFVGGLPQNASAAELRAHFEAFGVVSDAVVMMDPATSRSRGFGFVCFLPGQEGAAAVAASLERYAHHRLRGKWIEVKSAAPPHKLVGKDGSSTSNGLSSQQEAHLAALAELEKAEERALQALDEPRDAPAPSKALQPLLPLPLKAPQVPEPAEQKTNKGQVTVGTVASPTRRREAAARGPQKVSPGDTPPGLDFGLPPMGAVSAATFAASHAAQAGGVSASPLSPPGLAGCTDEVEQVKAPVNLRLTASPVRRGKTSRSEDSKREPQKVPLMSDMATRPFGLDAALAGGPPPPPSHAAAEAYRMAAAAHAAAMMGWGQMPLMAGSTLHGLARPPLNAATAAAAYHAAAAAHAATMMGWPYAGPPLGFGLGQVNPAPGTASRFSGSPIGLEGALTQQREGQQGFNWEAVTSQDIAAFLARAKKFGARDDPV